jgi:hypothetical protein
MKEGPMVQKVTKKAVEIDGEKYKDCSKCKATKKVTEFSKRKQSSDGLEYWCKTCKSNYFKGKNYKKTGASSKKDGLDYFTKLGLTSFIEGFTKVFDRAKEEYLCNIKSPYREQLCKMLERAFNESVLPAIQKQLPQQNLLHEEVKKLQRQLLEKDERIGDLEVNLRDEKEYRQDLQKGVRSM